MKEKFQQIKELLKSAKTAIIASHVDPDGDAIGSMLALGMLLEQKGLGVTYYSADQVPLIYRFLPGTERIKRELLLQQHADLCFVLDSSDSTRVGERIEPKQVAKKVINIDHHPDNSMFGDVNCAAPTSSTAEIVYDLARFLGLKIDHNIADCLYAAIITDTGNFRYENTTVKTFLIAAELLKAGVRTQEISTRIYDTKTVASVRIAARVLSGMRFSPDRKIAWAVATEEMMRETGAKPEEMTGIVDHLRSIEGVEVAIFFREEKGKVKMNFRSKDKINVSEIARRFGGGGHVRAAGAALEGSGAEVVEKVIAEAQKHLKASSFLV